MIHKGWKSQYTAHSTVNYWVSVAYGAVHEQMRTQSYILLLEDTINIAVNMNRTQTNSSEGISSIFVYFCLLWKISLVCIYLVSTSHYSEMTWKGGIHIGCVCVCVYVCLKELFTEIWSNQSVKELVKCIWIVVKMMQTWKNGRKYSRIHLCLFWSWF